MTAPGRTNLGPGFWQVTIAMTVLNAVLTYLVIVFPIGQYLPEAAQPSDQIDLLFKFMAVFGNAIFIYVTGYLVYFSIVWRRRKDEPLTAIGIQIHDNPTLELWWTIVPTILVVILGILSVKIWTELQTLPPGGLAIESIGHQFGFEFRYPNLKSSISTGQDPDAVLYATGHAAPAPDQKSDPAGYAAYVADAKVPHLPVNVPVTLYVTSTDVIHSFWIPEIRLKADMVPGNVQPIRFTPSTIGNYRIVCAQFCGGYHGQMYGHIKIDSAADYAKWIAGVQSYQAQVAKGFGAPTVAVGPGDASAGKLAFAAHNCSSCHNAAATFEGKVVGPGLLKLTDNPQHPKLVTGTLPTPADIASLLNAGYSGPDKSASEQQPPIGAMPNATTNGLSPKDIANLTAYLVSLK